MSSNAYRLFGIFLSFATILLLIGSPSSDLNQQLSSEAPAEQHAERAYIKKFCSLNAEILPIGCTPQPAISAESAIFIRKANYPVRFLSYTLEPGAHSLAVPFGYDAKEDLVLLSADSGSDLKLKRSLNGSDKLGVRVKARSPLTTSLLVIKRGDYRVSQNLSVLTAASKSTTKSRKHVFKFSGTIEDYAVFIPQKYQRRVKKLKIRGNRVTVKTKKARKKLELILLKKGESYLGDTGINISDAGDSYEDAVSFTNKLSKNETRLEVFGDNQTPKVFSVLERTSERSSGSDSSRIEQYFSPELKGEPTVSTSAIRFNSNVRSQPAEHISPLVEKSTAAGVNVLELNSNGGSAADQIAAAYPFDLDSLHLQRCGTRQSDDVCPPGILRFNKTGPSSKELSFSKPPIWRTTGEHEEIYGVPAGLMETGSYRESVCSSTNGRVLDLRTKGTTNRSSLREIYLSDGSVFTDGWLYVSSILRRFSPGLHLAKRSEDEHEDSCRNKGVVNKSICVDSVDDREVTYSYDLESEESTGIKINTLSSAKSVTFGFRDASGNNLQLRSSSSGDFSFDCRALGYEGCSDGACYGGGDPECKTNGDCGSGEVCKAGACEEDECGEEVLDYHPASIKGLSVCGDPINTEFLALPTLADQKAAESLHDYDVTFRSKYKKEKETCGYHRPGSPEIKCLGKESCDFKIENVDLGFLGKVNDSDLTVERSGCCEDSKIKAKVHMPRFKEIPPATFHEQDKKEIGLNLTLEVPDCLAKSEIFNEFQIFPMMKDKSGKKTVLATSAETKNYINRDNLTLEYSEGTDGAETNLRFVSGDWFGYKSNSKNTGHLCARHPASYLVVQKAKADGDEFFSSYELKVKLDSPEGASRNFASPGIRMDRSFISSALIETENPEDPSQCCFKLSEDPVNLYNISCKITVEDQTQYRPLIMAEEERHCQQYTEDLPWSEGGVKQLFSYQNYLKLARHDDFFGSDLIYCTSPSDDDLEGLDGQSCLSSKIEAKNLAIRAAGKVDQLNGIFDARSSEESPEGVGRCWIEKTAKRKIGATPDVASSHLECRYFGGCSAGMSEPTYDIISLYESIRW